MNQLSLAKLAELTGLDPRTIKPRISGLTPVIKGRSHLYDTTKALPLIYSANHASAESGKVVDYHEERARLTHHQANIAGLEEEELRGSLVKVEEVADLWINSISNAKAKLLALPSKITHQLLSANDHKSALSIFQLNINEALEELASGDIRPTVDGVDSTMDASAESDSKPVGGQRKEAVA